MNLFYPVMVIIQLLFTENETNHALLFPGQLNESPHVKDGINDFIVLGRKDAVNPDLKGTKAAAHIRMKIGAGKSAEVRLRLSKKSAAGKECRFWRGL